MVRLLLWLGLIGPALVPQIANAVGYVFRVSCPLVDLLVPLPGVLDDLVRLVVEVLSLPDLLGLFLFLAPGVELPPRLEALAGPPWGGRGGWFYYLVLFIT